jgi:intraflagellar transport protein 88
LALTYDRFNAKARVNKGNCYFFKKNYVKAKECYLEAIGIEADCIEALYNLAFVNKQMNQVTEAIAALEKLRSIQVQSPEIIYQIASVYEISTDYKSAIKWYDLLINQ